MVQCALVLATALFSADAASVETPVQKPSGWLQGRRTGQDQTIELTFAVKQTGKPELHDALMLAIRGKKFSFDKVLKMIDDMVDLAPVMLWHH